MNRQGLQSAVNPLEKLVARKWFPAVLITAVVAVSLFDAFHPDALFAYRDSLHYTPPLFQLVREEWLAGRPPLWNPLLNNGQPLAALGNSGAFYPPQLLAIFLLPDGLSLNVLLVAHLILAAAGAFQLARDMGCAVPAACIAALTYGFGGSVFLQIYNPAYGMGPAWLAWAIVGGWRLLDAPGIRPFTLLAASLAMCVLCGEPQTAYHAGLVLGLRWLAARPFRWRSCLLLAAAGLAGALLSYVQVAVAAEFTRESSRAMDIAPHSIWDLPRYFSLPSETRALATWYEILIGRPGMAAEHYADTYAFSIVPWRLVECFWPDASGMPYARWAMLAGLDTATAWANSLYAGLLPAAAVVVLAMWRGRGVPWAGFWLLVAGLSLAAALGGLGLSGLVRTAGSLFAGDWRAIGYRAGDEVGGVYWLLSVAAPGYAAFRYPAKWMTVFTLAWACLAGLLVNRLDEPVWRERLQRAVAVIGGICGAGAIGLAGAAVLAGPSAVLPAGSDPARAAQVFWAVFSGGVHACVVAVCVWSALAARRGQGWSKALQALLCVMTVADLAIAARREVLVGRFGDLVESSDYLRELEQGRRPEMAAASPRMRIVALGAGMRRADTRDIGRFVRYTGVTLRANVPWLHGCEKFGEIGTAMFDDIEALAAPSREQGHVALPRRVFDLAAVDFFIIPTEGLPPGDADRFLREWSPEQLRGENRGRVPLGPRLRVAEVPIPQAPGEPPAVIVARNESGLPRVRIVHDAIVEPAVTKRDWLRWEEQIQSIAFPSEQYPDLRSRAVIEQPVDGPPTPTMAAAEPAATATSSPESCRIAIDEPQRVVVEAELGQPGYVVLADAFHRDWTCEVTSDGGSRSPLPVLRANRIHRACHLPAGRHVLEFRYHSATYARAIWITLAAWAAAGLAVVLAGRVGPARGRKPASHNP
ncbi:hypothetical protein LBMAG47_21750 [Planctomycetia bacterium]|nr:hypothetical protein LBMAG47_21750 [Planctomycetia bacterium]